MGARLGAHTIGNVVDKRSPLGVVWADGLSDLEVHGYEPVRELVVSAHAAVLVVRRRGWSEQEFVVKAFASCSAVDSTKREIGPMQEAMLLKGIEHPHIVKYVETWWTPGQANSGRLSLVMEHAEDGDLHVPRLAMLSQEQHLEEGLVGRWSRQILEALAYLHSRGIVHRDLKTSNVFLKNSWATALLGDFGISTVLARVAFAENFAGTPAYMSPECVRNEPFGTAVDIWAVGVIMYELMALELPFVGNLLALIYKISHTELREQSLRSAGYSDMLVSLVKSVFVKDATLRPTAIAVLDNEFWSSCDLANSEALAHSACSANRQDQLLQKLDRKVSSGTVETASGPSSSGFSSIGGLPILDSWSSSNDATFLNGTSVLDTPAHGSDLMSPMCVTSNSDFYIEEDTMTRSVPFDFPAAATTAGPGLADEALREELRAAHASGVAMTPEYLEALLQRLGASDSASQV